MGLVRASHDSCNNAIRRLGREIPCQHALLVAHVSVRSAGYSQVEATSGRVGR